MKKQIRYFMAAAGVALLVMSGKTAVNAQEAVAPVTADQLMAVVNAQCAAVNSMHETIAETVQMTDTRTGRSVEADMTVDMRENRQVTHMVMAMNLATSGISQTVVEESYASVANGFLSTYVKEPGSGRWEVSHERLSPAQLVSQANPFALSGMDTTGSVVTTDGQVFRFTAALDSNNMADFVEILGASGLTVKADSFPVTVEIDAATLLPKSMTVSITGLHGYGNSSIEASAVSVVTYGEYNQFDTLAIPPEVIAAAK